MKRERMQLLGCQSVKPYSQSVVPTQFSSVKTVRICKPCSVQFSCTFGDSSFLLQLLPRGRKTQTLFATHKPYSQSVVPTQFSSVQTMRICKPCSVQFTCKFGNSSFLLQLLPRSRKTKILFATYKPYSQSVVPTQFSSVKTMRICKPCSVQFNCKFGESSFLLQLLQRTRKTLTLILFATYKPYSQSVVPTQSLS